MNLRAINENTVGVSLDETTSEEDVRQILSIISNDRQPDFTLADLVAEIDRPYPSPFARSSQYLTHPVFNRYHSETEMLRYLKRLENRDLSLTSSMIPLGSCTMKLNAAVEMIPVSWPEFNRIHPFAPNDPAAGVTVSHEFVFEAVHWIAWALRLSKLNV